MLSSKCSFISNQIIKPKYVINASQSCRKTENKIQSLQQQSKILTIRRNYAKSVCVFKTNDEVLQKKNNLANGPGLEFFVANSTQKQLRVKDRIKIRKSSNEDHPYLNEHDLRGDGKQGI